MNNLEAKQEAIKNAYGECWEKVKDYVDNAEDFIWWNLNVIKHQKYFSLNNLCFSLFLLYLYFNLKTK